MKWLWMFIGLWMLAGCFSIEEAKSPYLGKDVESHVVVSNYGWSLFGCVPLLCGNANLDSQWFFVLFRDDVKHELAYQQLEALAKRRHCKLDEVLAFDDRFVIFDYFYTAAPWIIQYKEVNYSAMLVKETK